jgi:hypothetical protein
MCRKTFRPYPAPWTSVSRTLDLNTPSVLTTVWGISSWLIHVTVVPTDTLSVSGPKLKLSILTSALAAEGWLFAETLPNPANSSSSRITTGVITLAIHMFFFVIFFPFVAISFVILPDGADFVDLPNR